MASVSTQPLSGDNPNDFLTISVDHLGNDPDSVGKTGYYKVVINSVTWTGDNLDPDTKITLDIRAPQFNAQNDTALLDKAELASDAESVTLDHTVQVHAVVSSFPGPGIYTQGDGTWDLLSIKTSVPAFSDLSDLVVTVDYTVTWTEVTSFTGLASTHVDLHVDDDKEADTTSITTASESGDGIFVLLPVSLVTGIKDHEGGDSVPLFSVSTSPTVGGFSLGYNVVLHPVSKSSSHTKAYQTKGAMVFAINGGKIDANATKAVLNIDGVVTTYYILGNASLSRVAEWASDDTVDATFNYKVGFVAV